MCIISLGQGIIFLGVFGIDQVCSFFANSSSFSKCHTSHNTPGKFAIQYISNAGSNPLHPIQKGSPFSARKGELDPIWEILSNLFRWVTGCTSTMCLRWQLASCQVSRSRSRTSWMKAATSRQLRVWKRGKGKPLKHKRTRVLEERSREQCWKKKKRRGTIMMEFRQEFLPNTYI